MLTPSGWLALGMPGVVVADVFVSYSRRDSEFVGRLADDLRERGKDVWVDVEGLRDAERFPEALKRAIEGVDAFVFVISPESVSSEFCEQEVQHAAELNKRIVPLALRPVPDEQIPEEIRYRSWIAVETPTQPPTDRMITAIETDLAWEQQHTQLTVRALPWDAHGRDGSMLLRGSELAAAERWLTDGANQRPGPTALEQGYVFASRAAVSRRQRTLVGIVSAMLVVAIGLLIFALISRSQAVSAQTRATAQALAAESETQQSVDPELAVLLAMDGVRDRVSYGENGTMFALRSAIDASTIRYRFPVPPGQMCSLPTASYDPAPGSDLIAEGLCTNELVIADARDGRVLRTVRLPGSPTSLEQFTATGSGLIVAAGTKVLELDPRTGAIVRRGPSVSGLVWLRVDPRAPIVALVSPQELDFWNVDTGALTVTRPPALRSLFQLGANSFTYSPDGRELAVTLNPPESAIRAPGVVLYDIARRRIVARALASANGEAFSPDGRLLAVGSNTNTNPQGTIVMLNARTLSVIPGFHPIVATDVSPTSMAFSPHGSELAYGFADGTAGLASAATGAPIVTYLGNTSVITSESFSPDGRLVLTSAADGTVHAWRAGGLALRAIPAATFNGAIESDADGFVTNSAFAPTPGADVVMQRWSDDGHSAPPLVIARTRSVDAYALAPGGRFALLVPAYPPTARFGSYEIWDTIARRIVRTDPRTQLPSGNPPVLSADGRYVALDVQPTQSTQVVTSYLEVLDTLTGRTRRLAATTCSNGWSGLTFSPGDRLLAGGTFCGQVSVWNLATARQQGPTLKLGGQLSQVALRPDLRQLAAGSWDGRILISPIPVTGRSTQVLTQNGKGVDDVAYGPTGRYLASAGLDSTVRLFDAHTLTELRVIAQPGPTTALSFTSDGRDILTAAANHQTVFLWDACTDCENPTALLALADTRVTRHQLTTAERHEFGVN